ncbi:unnamed protein product [Blepharisma stoltei]|uniref:HMG box domain-containing protein n=1 Tax=Blepharisma stoltei TaxID=1481888 RepID=A0AAU9KBZ5_9CILI|nr:unnamed protein product [Blepharisma stoltei]
MEQKRPRGRPRKQAEELPCEVFKVLPPRKGKSALTFFLMEMKLKNQESNRQVNYDDFIKEATEKWAHLSSYNKKIYIEKANKDEQRYRRQTKEYNEFGVYYGDDGKLVYPPRSLKRKSSNSNSRENVKRKAEIKSNKE